MLYILLYLNISRKISFRKPWNQLHKLGQTGRLSQSFAKPFNWFQTKQTWPPFG